MKFTKTLLLLCGVTLLLGSCKSAPRKIAQVAPGDSISDLALLGAGTSLVEISYILDRDHYKFSAKKIGKIVTASTYRDAEMIRQGRINESLYPGFLKKALSLFERADAKKSENSKTEEFCRSPFVLTVKLGGDQAKSLRGCRGSPEGSISKLVKEGEFLLYSYDSKGNTPSSSAEVLLPKSSREVP